MNTKSTNGTEISVIIISYNTSKLTIDCLKSLTFVLKREQKLRSEIIVVDNASSDYSVRKIRDFISRSPIPLKLIENKKNFGFGIANNQGVKKAQGKYILLLNSDTLMENINFSNLIDYLNSNNDVGILTVNVKFPHGAIDPASHRGFPTIWRSFCFFSGLERFAKNTVLARLFGGYHLTYEDLSKVHEIDCPAGAFFLMPRSVFDEVDGFDKTFFMYGEDLDLAYRIKQKGYKVIYYPEYTILHLKHQSGLQSNEKTRNVTRKHFYEAMKIFYKKHYAKTYPSIVNALIYSAIDIKYKLS